MQGDGLSRRAKRKNKVRWKQLDSNHNKQHTQDKRLTSDGKDNMLEIIKNNLMHRLLELVSYPQLLLFAKTWIIETKNVVLFQITSNQRK